MYIFLYDKCQVDIRYHGQVGVFPKVRLAHGTQGVLTPVVSSSGANLTEICGREGLCPCLTLKRHFRVNSAVFCHSRLVSLEFVSLYKQWLCAFKVCVYCYALHNTHIILTCMSSHLSFCDCLLTVGHAPLFGVLASSLKDLWQNESLAALGLGLLLESLHMTKFCHGDCSTRGLVPLKSLTILHSLFLGII